MRLMLHSISSCSLCQPPAEVLMISKRNGQRISSCKEEKKKRNCGESTKYRWSLQLFLISPSGYELAISPPIFMFPKILGDEPQESTGKYNVKSSSLELPFFCIKVINLRAMSLKTEINHKSQNCIYWIVSIYIEISYMYFTFGIL